MAKKKAAPALSPNKPEPAPSPKPKPAKLGKVCRGGKCK